MKYLDEYKDKKLVDFLVGEIHKKSKKKIRLMEVCGGHTNAIQRFGIPSLLPNNIELLSGPGCPVCVTGKQFIDKTIFLTKNPNNHIFTYGDLMRVPGSGSSLEREKAKGANINVISSTIDAISFAEEFPDNTTIFLGIGFETTAPATAIAILEAQKKGLKNFYLLSAHKIMPPAMEALIHEGVSLHGYICPGHVSTITGSEMYLPIVNNHHLGCVISGFEPVDILQSILMLVEQFENSSPKLEIQYKRAVKAEGNILAKQRMKTVFDLKDEEWRGFGIIPQSGLKLKNEFARFDIEKKIEINIPKATEEPGCICGDILKGWSKPKDCKLYKKSCTPVNPIGACMVSNEGACQAYFRYN